MIFLTLIKNWKNILFCSLIALLILTTTIICVQHNKLKNYDQKIINIESSWKNKFEKLNNEGMALQREYDLLEQQHKLKVEALNEKVRQQKIQSDLEYKSLLSTNGRLHETLRDSTNKLSNLSREAAIDYSKRSSELLGRCSEEYIRVAKAARDLGIDRDALEDAYPKKE